MNEVFIVVRYDSPHGNHKYISVCCMALWKDAPVCGMAQWNDTPADMEIVA
jgi:hypothetical protein